MSSFIDVLFPTNVSRGMRASRYRPIDVYALTSGAEARNAKRYNSRRTYNNGIGVRKPEEIAELLEFWEAVGGALCSFRFRDPTEYKSCLRKDTATSADQLIGEGDGTTVAFQLVKRYVAGTREYIREITKPVSGSVLVEVDGVAASGVSVDSLTGIINFSTAPVAGAQIRAGYHFDVPVRFDGDDFASQADWDCGESIPAFSLIEVIGE